MTAMEQRVTRGFELLNKVRPGWYKTIDLSILNQMSDKKCVVAQSFPIDGYFIGITVLSGNNGATGYDGCQWTINHAYSCAYHKDYAEYTKEWTRQITLALKNDAVAFEESGSDVPRDQNGAFVTTTDLDRLGEIVRQHMAKAIEVGHNHTNGAHTDSGMAYNLLGDLGLVVKIGA